ncbi:TetR/AcrR family transcriptional regulator [Sandaracinobacter sp. RS1-74]|uniref:TetR/AcrR family transcriptional regulator n=1 Tax=Sandaracinobacteroides sayramensis TaxID=2913411 RepID=UPI001EDAD9C7|nr:TetR/AcrR family transcriptional regulator [Sandaracinobacteroides sayramensis]
MKERSPALVRVCEAAVSHFAVAGYDGASLSEIARMVGIRKASLYSHFDGKDELFLQVLKDAIAVESRFAADILAADVSSRGPGAGYVDAIAERHESSVHLRYLLRTAYLPPTALKHAIGEGYEQFLTVLRSGFLRQLDTSGLAHMQQTDRVSYGEAYIGIVESLFVELTYAGREPMQVRRDALWSLLTDSLAMRTAKERHGR